MAKIETAMAIRLHGVGMEKLSIDEVPVLDPQAGEILVRIHAVSLNYREVLIITGRYGTLRNLPLILGSDGAGEVIAVGPEVTRFKEGDRVATTFFQKWHSGEATQDGLHSALGSAIDGAFTTYKVLSENGVVPIPDHLSYEEAATLPCAALTAWQTLFVRANIQPGNTVLVLGTGGVSIFALQMGLMAGASVIVTSSSDEKLERARKLGASHTINYKTNPDWDKEVRQLTHGRGVDVVVEVGGAGTFEKSIRSIRPGGHVGIIGNLSGIDAKINLGSCIRSLANIDGIYVGSRQMFEDMNRAIALHQMHPVIDRVYPLAEWHQAIEDLQKGQHFGKLVIRME